MTMGVFSPTDRARPGDEIAFRVEFLFTRHRAVQAKVNAFHSRRGCDACEQLLRDTLPRRGRERAAGGDEMRAVSGNDFHVA